jgi:hypothetical protein
MRALVLVLVLLAIAKVGYQEYMYRSATNEVIITAYRDRATAACQRDAKGQSLAGSPAWAQLSHIKLLIGKSNLDVYIWQVDHALWNARYRNPYARHPAGRGGRHRNHDRAYRAALRHQA